ncbi:hypothetical protein J4219_05575 [Candidatus Woesearchaeota archaeon]|nr:hypothetical protein [Candidatus Woesearchaeota archaeon]
MTESTNENQHKLKLLHRVISKWHELKKIIIPEYEKAKSDFFKAHKEMWNTNGRFKR